MARMQTSGLDKLISDMQKIGEGTGKMANAMVGAAANEIKSAWRESAEKAWPHRNGNNRALRNTGDMIDSIGPTGPVRSLGDAVYQEISALGKDSNGTRNAEKAFVLNYGTSRIEPTHWVDEAEVAAGPRVQEKLEDLWGDYLETGKVPTITDTGSTSGGITTTVK